MHEDLIGRLKFALEKQKAGAFSYLFSEAIAALSAQPDAASGGDARFYAHPSGDGAICRSGSTTRLCLDELLAALNSVAARQPAQGGTVNGWRMIDGVTVFDVASHSGIVEPQQFVRYADFLAAHPAVPEGIDVRRILLRVVPGEDGMGHEIYAKSVEDVEREFSRMSFRIDELEHRAPAPAAVPAGLQDIIGSMLNYAGVADTCEVTQGHAPVAIRNWAEMLQQLAPSAAVPVDAVRELLMRRIAQWRTHIPANPDTPGTRAIQTYGETDYNNDVAIWRQGIAVMDEALALLADPPAPAAVPVDERQDAAIVEAAKLAYGLLWMGTGLTGPDLAHRARVALRDALGKQACGEGINAARATQPQPAAAKDGDA